MGDIPFHPVSVHIPLGIAIILPFIALGQLVAIWRRWLPAKVWFAVALLSLVLVASGLVSLKAGQQEEERVAWVVDSSHIRDHEEAAETFLILAGITAALALAALAWRSGRWGTALRAATVVAAFLTLGQGIVTGHKGGQLVYKYGACRAYLEEVQK